MTAYDGHYDDARVRASMVKTALQNIEFDEQRMVLVIIKEEALCDECDKESPDCSDCDPTKRFEVPARFEVCSTCKGKGSHVNPSIDSHGITGDEWDEWGYEEQDAYMNGAYDVTCNECNGKRSTIGFGIFETSWTELALSPTKRPLAIARASSFIGSGSFVRKRASSLGGRIPVLERRLQYTSFPTKCEKEVRT